ncbi:MAG: glycosyltransferase family 4 protein [Desulfobacteraceae bacterium]|nr:glycosyltransferase family 4 protein [Desulfobacteraceae bacterium]
MRIVFFDFNINFGGAPQGTVYLAERLSKNADVHILDAYGSCKLYCNSIRKSRIPLHILCPDAKRHFIGYSQKPIRRLLSLIGSIPELLLLRKALIAKISELKPSAIWVNNEKSLVFISTCLKIRKIPIVIYIRSWATPDQMSLKMALLLKNKVRIIIVHSMASYQQISSLGLSEKKIRYTPNVVNFDNILSLSLNRPENPLPDLNRRLKILLPAARPVREKGHLTAVRSLSLIRKHGIDAVLWFPGSVPVGNDDSFLQLINREIKDLGLIDHVKFIGWRNDMPSVIKAADIIILPSYTEGFPRVILEAMLLKKPVCATPVGGIPELIQHMHTGMIFEKDDYKTLSEQIILLIRDKQFFQRIVDAAHEAVLKEYNPTKNTEIVRNAFLECIKT